MVKVLQSHWGLLHISAAWLPRNMHICKAIWHFNIQSSGFQISRNPMIRCHINSSLHFHMIAFFNAMATSPPHKTIPYMHPYLRSTVVYAHFEGSFNHYIRGLVQFIIENLSLFVLNYYSSSGISRKIFEYYHCPILGSSCETPDWYKKKILRLIN